MIYGKFFVLLVAVRTASIFATNDYCNTNLCAEGQTHIACRNNGEVNPLCLAPFIVPMTSEYRNQIVRKHNSRRNQIARGFHHFPPAKRMATMIWDYELARLAELNVKQCEMRYDQCRNTDRFSFVGQNLALKSWSKVNFNASEITSSQIHAWFRERISCPRNVIRSYTYSNDHLPYTSFTTMIQEQANHIGCAILRSSSGDFHHQIMACNYAFANILGAPVYSTGETASLCTTGTNVRFTSLCSIREKYNLKK